MEGENGKLSFGYRPDFIDLYTSYPPPEIVKNLAGKGVWELYNVNEDPTVINNVASVHPVRLARMKARATRTVTPSPRRWRHAIESACVLYETNVSLDYKEGDNAFTGKINRVTINVN